MTKSGTKCGTNDKVWDKERRLYSVAGCVMQFNEDDVMMQLSKPKVEFRLRLAPLYCEDR